MGYIEVFTMNSEGAGWLDLSDIPAETLLELEIGLFQEGALQGVSIPKLSVAQAIITINNNERKTKMGNILDELKDLIAIPCDECNGAGFIFFGDEKNYDVESCDCVNDEELI